MSARLLLNKYLPAILFAICLLIAVVLALSTPALWPAALAIAIAGAAMALALRLQFADESVEPNEEIAELKKANADLRSEIQNTYSIIDELADVVEQVATVTADSENVARDDVEGLRSQIASLQSASQPVLPPVVEDERVDGILLRLSALEDEVREREKAHDATLSLTQIAPSDEVAEAPAPEASTGNLRSLIARVGGGAAVASAAAIPAGETNAADADTGAVDTADVTASAPQEITATLAPVFEPDLGAPIAFILSDKDAASDEDVSILIRHGIQISEELESAGREVLLFLRVPPKALERLSVRRDIISAIDSSSAFQRRLTMLTSQTGFNATVQNTLMEIADSGCKFALENVRDWSLDLADLAKSGLRFIAVDGLAMANSAVQQGGDPRRLAQALAAHDIALIGGSVASSDDMEAVRSLEPALVTGNGLGEARVLEPAV